MDKLLITNTYNKNKLLKEDYKNKRLSKYKYMDEDELIKHLYFDYDKRAIYYLMKKYHLKVENVIMYLENMYYISDIDDDKVKYLMKLKNELINEDLLIIDHLFERFLEKFELIYDNDFYKTLTPKLLCDLKKYCHVIIPVKEDIKVHKHPLYKFQTIPEEIHFVCEKICSLVDSGILLSDIKIVNAHSEYEFDLKRICNYYGIPLNIKNNSSIISTKVVSTFLALFRDLPLHEVIESLQNKYKSSQDQITINKIINILNEYSWCDNIDDEIYEMIYYDLKNTKIDSVKYKDGVVVTDLFDVDDNDYVFFLGMNADTVPMVKKDESYLNDSVKEKLGLFRSVDENRQMKKLVKEKIQSIKNLWITYKVEGKNSEAYPSSLLEEIECDLVTDNNYYSYSTMEEKILLAIALDEYRNYGEITNDLTKYYPLHRDLNYQTYDNKYRPISKEIIKKYLKEHDGLVLSYSKLNDYMKCHFRYYLENILKISKYEETFAAIIGSYAHYLLEKKDEIDFDFDKYSYDFLSKYTFNYKEKFLLKKIKKELQYVIKVTNKFENLSDFNKYYHEEKIVINKDCDIPVIFKGFIDKIMAYKENNEAYVSLIDYKTGGYDASLNHVYHGLGLQLPIYAYLTHNSELFKKYKLAGFYIAPILVKEDILTNDTDRVSKKQDKMKLIGYSINEADILSKFDPTYENSMMIKSMKTTKNGFSTYSKVLSRSEMDNLVVFIDKLIDKAIKDIISGDFNINPKLIDNKNMSCSYCPYEEICYHKYEDLKSLENKNYKDFLGGEQWEEFIQKNS